MHISDKVKQCDRFTWGRERTVRFITRDMGGDVGFQLIRHIKRLCTCFTPQWLFWVPAKPCIGLNPQTNSQTPCMHTSSFYCNMWKLCPNIYVGFPSYPIKCPKIYHRATSLRQLASEWMQLSRELPAKQYLDKALPNSPHLQFKSTKIELADDPISM